MSLRGKPNIFTIAPGAPFLPTLAQRLIDGTLVSGFKADGDPLRLAKATIYVPTRRAARALRSEFAQLSGVNAAILPSIRPLGEFDEDFDFAGGSLDLDPPIGREDRLIQLAVLVRKWAQALPEAARALFGSDPMVLPATSADAIWLARNLADLMDEAEREGGDWSKLKELVPDELASWWQLTLGFMQIVTEHWPEHLAEKGLSDAVAHRNAAIRAEADRLASRGSDGPVIAAGSTGSNPATAELLKVIARLPNGALVLPGLDMTLGASAWDAVGRSLENPSVFGHPQFGLRTLLDFCQAIRDDVIELGIVGEDITARNSALSLALLPADETGAWSGLTDRISGFGQVCEIAAPSEAAEALAIAVALREAVELGHTPAALVTADRTLARRVSAELERFGIVADDSGGTPLDQTPPAALFSLMLGLAFDTPDPASLLSLLQHPLTSLGKDRKAARRGAEVIDLQFLRGEVLPLDADAILALLRTPNQDAVKNGRDWKWSFRFEAHEIETAADLCLSLCDAVAPLHALKGAQEVSVEEACRASVRAFEAIGLDAETGLSRLYGGEAGEKFAELLRALCALKADFRFAPAEWPAVFRAFMSGLSVKPRHGSDPRVFIWGALEARLQNLETVILGGLNETIWPTRPPDDPFLSRSMKKGVLLDPPERRIGLAAHDFQMLMGQPRVILSRSARRDGSPTVPSRWLQRLHALLGKEAALALQERGAIYVDWAGLMDKGEETRRCDQPRPKPPLHLRPAHFSVTEIETLRRDPYAVYAKKILGLEPLPDLIREADARERGNLFHKILERFVVERSAAPGLHEDLVTIGQEEFSKAALPAQTQALWWRRFERTAASFIEAEAKGHDRIFGTFTEAKAEATAIADTGVTLSGRADRIDILNDGTAAVIDYKSGQIPSQKEVHTLIAPQLPLEAALLVRGAYADIRQTQASELVYIKLESKGEVTRKVMDGASAKSDLSAAELAEKAWEKLAAIIRHFGQPETPYLSHVLPKTARMTDGDYDHLARLREWASETGDEEADGT